jgi:nitroreductase
MRHQLNESIFLQRRSIRRFQQKEIPESFLRKCVNGARLAPSGKNLQPIEYIIVTDQRLRNQLFSHLHWAGYLGSTWNPDEDEQPMAYIVLIVEKQDNSLVKYDVGISFAYLVLYAETKNIGSCILQNIDHQEIKQLLHIPDSHSIEGVVALGYKKEHPIVETNENTSKYWLDEKNVLHVPKRPLNAIIHKQTYS